MRRQTLVSARTHTHTDDDAKPWRTITCGTCCRRFVVLCGFNAQGGQHGAQRSQVQVGCTPLTTALNTITGAGAQHRVGCGEPCLALLTEQDVRRRHSAVDHALLV